MNQNKFVVIFHVCELEISMVRTMSVNSTYRLKEVEVIEI